MPKVPKIAKKSVGLETSRCHILYVAILRSRFTNGKSTLVFFHTLLGTEELEPPNLDLLATFGIFGNFPKSHGHVLTPVYSR